VSTPYRPSFFQSLITHLVAANRQEEASELLADLDWMHAKLRATDVNALLADYHLTPAHEQVRLVEGALRTAAHVISRDSGQLATQLHGRLLALDTPPARRVVQRVRQAQRDPWLRPLTATLSPPGGPLLRTLTGWGGHVEVVAVTPDARQAITGALHGILKVWDLETGIERHDLQRFENAITALAVTPDSRHLLVGLGGGRLQLWDLSTGTEPFLLAGHDTTVSAVTVTADGRRAVSLAAQRWTDQGGIGGELKVWDLSTGSELHAVVYNSASRPLAMAAEGGRVLAAGGGNAVEVWDSERGERLHVMGRHQSYIRAVAMAADGRMAVTAEDDDLRWAGNKAAPMEQICALRVWDLERGVLRHLLTGHTRTVRSIMLTADERLAVSASDDHTVRVWDLVEGRECCTLAGHANKVRAAAVTLDGRRVVSASDDHTIKVWDPWAAGAPQSQPSHDGRVTAVALTSDGHRAVSAAEDGTLRTWDLASGAPLAAWTGSQNELTALASMPDGRHVLSGEWGGTVRLWDLDSQAQVHAFEPQHGSITALAIAPDGRLAACATEYGQGAVLDLVGRRVLRSFRLRGGNLSMNDLVLLTTEGQLLTLSDHHTPEVWEPAARTGLRQGGGQPGRHVHTLRGYPPLNGPASFAVTPDGRRAVGAAGRHTIVWDLERGAKLYTLANRTGFVTAAAVTPDGRRAVVAEDDNALTVWDLDRGVQLHTMVGHSDHVAILLATSRRALAMSTTGDTLGVVPGITADRGLKLWDLERGIHLAGFNGESLITAAAITPDERTVVAGEESGQVHLLRLELAVEPESAPPPPVHAQRRGLPNVHGAGRSRSSGRSIR
jgi:WD40 repeat protein